MSVEADHPMTVAASLDDKYTLESGRVYLTGTQALIRLPMMQRQRDLRDGLNTAGFISGYRGSPLGVYDLNLWRAKPFLDSNHIRFQPGVNEELAATAVWGSQQTNLFEGARYDGVFSIWYGKGPGLDRAMDAIKHGNAAGTSPHGGVLVLAGDDHGAVSSTLAHQSDHAMVGAMVPVINPAGVQDYIDYGLLGWAMSRYAGIWVGFTAVADTVESSASVLVDPHRLKIVKPEDFEMPPGGLNIRWPDTALEQEARLHDYKRYAVRAFARANRFDRIVIDSPTPRLGIITTGKAYLDVRQALSTLGIDDRRAGALGIRVFKVGMSWPLDSAGLLAFAKDLEEILVVEEKRPLLEDQVKAQLYELAGSRRPRVIGKFDAEGNRVLCTAGILSPGEVAQLVGKRLLRFADDSVIRGRLEYLSARNDQRRNRAPVDARSPFFCSGCPHNRSTKVPEGSRALAGIGCHYMALSMNRDTATFSQMGGEGAAWVGQAPFTRTEHVFANLGDGTFVHSGSLAIRQALAAGVNITYKILFNDAVAMTGGQTPDGSPGVDRFAQIVRAEGVDRIAIVSDEPEKYTSPAIFPAGTSIHHRDSLDTLQRELRATPGVTVMIYDQTCAAEKRRRRKRGTFPDPSKRVFINELVCEGCGDCSVQSNCLSVVPVDTEFGRKRAIDQSSCNKDYSCLEGFCPSFVTVKGGVIRKEERTLPAFAPDIDLAEPATFPLTAPFGIVVTGIGGTGVITIGALIGMAAHLDGKGVTVLDQTGLAQKGGAVTSHVRIAPSPDDLSAVRIDTGGADLILGADLVVAASADVINTVENGRTWAIVNSHETPTADSTLDRDFELDVDRLRAEVSLAAGEAHTHFIDATAIATRLFGDSIATNMFLLGFAFQHGRVPVSLASMVRAIELNGVSVTSNKRAFDIGRRAVANPDALHAVQPSDIKSAPPTLHGLVDRRAAFLAEYQNDAYADRYRRLVAAAEAAETNRTPHSRDFTEGVARGAFKLMAYKDEYEVARLFAEGDFLRKLDDQFAGPYRIKFHLAPPLLARTDPASGRPEKMTFGPWMLSVFRLLAKCRGLRGSPFDPFGYLAERRAERQLIKDYEAMVATVGDKLTPENHEIAIELARLPETIRGYGPIKDKSVETANNTRADLLNRLEHPLPQRNAAA
ncbi:MAG: indolepyruvate ferredoxin oxidoreductase family protein [Alphaproteobacteria bacterium]